MWLEPIKIFVNSEFEANIPSTYDCCVFFYFFGFGEIPDINYNESAPSILQAIVWDEYLTGPFGLIAQYSLLKVN